MGTHTEPGSVQVPIGSRTGSGVPEIRVLVLVPVPRNMPVPQVPGSGRVRSLALKFFIPIRILVFPSSRHHALTCISSRKPIRRPRRWSYIFKKIKRFWCVRLLSMINAKTIDRNREIGRSKVWAFLGELLRHHLHFQAMLILSMRAQNTQLQTCFSTVDISSGISEKIPVNYVLSLLFKNTIIKNYWTCSFKGLLPLLK